MNQMLHLSITQSVWWIEWMVPILQHFLCPRLLPSLTWLGHLICFGQLHICRNTMPGSSISFKKRNGFSLIPLRLFHSVENQAWCSKVNQKHFKQSAPTLQTLIYNHFPGVQISSSTTNWKIHENKYFLYATEIVWLPFVHQYCCAKRSLTHKMRWTHTICLMGCNRRDVTQPIEHSCLK